MPGSIIIFIEFMVGRLSKPDLNIYFCMQS